MLTMLQALSRRGPDSAGIAIAGHGNGSYVARISVALADDRQRAAHQVLEATRPFWSKSQPTLFDETLRLELNTGLDTRAIEEAIEMAGPGIEVVSLGSTVEIVKQVGSPAALDETYSVSSMTGTHAIGHTRMCTESIVDLSHSQPFWPHGTLDFAVAHNGHITNYHKLRRIYEQRGVHFHTNNDSEVIGIYLREKMLAGASLEQAVEDSIHELDGAFCYVVATADCLAFVKDSFGFKPLMVVETDDFIAIATEEIALQEAFGNDHAAIEPGAGLWRIWRRHGADEKSPQPILSAYGGAYA